MKTTYEIPVSNPTRVKESFLESVSDKFPKMVRWFLTIFEKENLDFRDIGLNKARTIVKKLCYPTAERDSKYNCKGAIHFPHSHYYDTAITEAIQKWNSFLTWKKKLDKKGKPSSKKFPKIKSYTPVFDSLMFNLDLENEWVTLKTGRGEENVHIPIKIPNKKKYDELDESKITSIQLCRNENGRFTFHLSQKISGSGSSAQSEQDSGVFALSIDLGERHLACETSVKITPSGKLPEKSAQRVKFHDNYEGKNQAYKEHHIKRKMQNQGKTNVIPKHNWKAKKVRHERVKEIINEVAESVENAMGEGLEPFIVLGDLHSPVPRNKGRLSRRLNEFPRAKLRDELIHKLAELGVQVHLVSESGTSIKCHECGSENTRRPAQGLFICENCELEYNSDANSAWNIMGRGVRRGSNAPKILRKWAESALGAVP